MENDWGFLLFNVVVAHTKKAHYVFYYRVDNLRKGLGVNQSCKLKGLHPPPSIITQNFCTP